MTAVGIHGAATIGKRRRGAVQPPLTPSRRPSRVRAAHDVTAPPRATAPPPERRRPSRASSSACCSISSPPACSSRSATCTSTCGRCRRRWRRRSRAGANLLGADADVDGTIIKAQHAALEINHECTGVFVLLVYAMFVLAYPAPWGQRLTGIAIGIGVLTGDQHRAADRADADRQPLSGLVRLLPRVLLPGAVHRAVGLPRVDVDGAGAPCDRRPDFCLGSSPSPAALFALWSFAGVGDLYARAVIAVANPLVRLLSGFWVSEVHAEGRRPRRLHPPRRRPPPARRERRTCWSRSSRASSSPASSRSWPCSAPRTALTWRRRLRAAAIGLAALFALPPRPDADRPVHDRPAAGARWAWCGCAASTG